MENKIFLSKQIITYIGNKRLLLDYIAQEIEDIQKQLNKEKTINADLFSGSGIVARLLKQYSSKLIVNDLEYYSFLINSCYLSNKNKFNIDVYNELYNKIEKRLSKNLYQGIIYNNYTAKDENDIKVDDRVFYTKENALIIDTIRDEISTFDEEYQKYFLAPLLYAASVNVNTAGVFKGFYKDRETKVGMFGGKNRDALSRIIKKIELEKPIFSNYECEVELYNDNAMNIAKKLKNLDIVYLDPPYNQHPYGSNYFMLNIIAKNKIDGELSKVSGIPNTWNRSNYNKKQKIKTELDSLINEIDSKYIILSYNSECFLTYQDIIDILEKYGKVKIKEIKYNTYRGSRNLKKRNKYVKEYIFTLNKITK